MSVELAAQSVAAPAVGLQELDHSMGAHDHLCPRAHNGPGEHDPASEEDDDEDDEVNTSGARVFFGPLKSPEAKFAFLRTPAHPRRLLNGSKDVANNTHTPLARRAVVSKLMFAPATPPDLITLDDDDSMLVNPAFTFSVVSPPHQPSLLDQSIAFDSPPHADMADEATSRDGTDADVTGELVYLPTPQSQSESALEPILIDLSSNSPHRPTATSKQEASSSLLTSSAAINVLRAGAVNAMEGDAPVSPSPLSGVIPMASKSTSLLTKTTVKPQSDASSQPGASPLAPKRKLSDAFPDSLTDDVSNKAPRLEAAAPGPSTETMTNKQATKLVRPVASVSARRAPRPRPEMLGSLSPESDGALSRLLAPAKTSLPFKINIDVPCAMPSFAASGIAMGKRPVASHERSSSPARRLPVAAALRSPSPPRRVLLSPSPPPSPTRSVHSSSSSATPAGSSAFPLISATSSEPVNLALRASPVKLMPQGLSRERAGVIVHTAARTAPKAVKPSQLRQPTARSTSKLPLPKPYAAPISRPAQHTGTSVMVSPVEVSKKSAVLPKITPSSSSHLQNQIRPSPRKIGDRQGPETSHPAVAPIVMRQVIPGTLGGRKDRADSLNVDGSSPVRPPQPAGLRQVEQGNKIINIRQVVPGSLRYNDGRALQSSPVNAKEAPPTLAPSPKKIFQLRQVIPGTLRDYKGRPTTPPPSNDSIPGQSTPQPSPPKRQGSIMVRPVIPGTLRDYPGRTTTPPLDSPSPPSPDSQEPQPVSSTSTSAARQIFNSPSPPPLPPLPSCSTNRGLFALTGIGLLRDQNNELVLQTSPGTPESQQLRWSPDLQARLLDFRSRSPSSSPSRHSSPIRRAAPTDNIILPIVPSVQPTQAATAPDAPRRTARARNKPGSSSSALNSVHLSSILPASANGLRALTSENTSKNEVWSVVELETVIVRRAGPRPASPSTKTKTLADRKRDDAGRQRQLRAKRRVIDSDDEQVIPRHMRGPGENEDYQTPERVRELFGARGRALRWDPDLVSTPERKVEDERHLVGRGILTPAPIQREPQSTLQLRREHVRVLKFVYDDDDEAILDELPPLPPQDAQPPTKLRKRKMSISGPP
ncbi:hypothetical protein BKA62DRAFT_765204 [Auriculariales sp. MPI-PUGE-AT-0066]|nr:hypothetical protein BKA62DRAFT_765204 [Auriculariales sp. MPI-PUGE-AT-0066]